MVPEIDIWRGAKLFVDQQSRVPGPSPLQNPPRGRPDALSAAGHRLKHRFALSALWRREQHLRIGRKPRQLRGIQLNPEARAVWDRKIAHIIKHERLR